MDYAARLKRICNQQKISIRTISQLASKQWKKESEAVKVFFKLLSDMYQERHKKIYPDYKYTPKKSFKKARRNELKRKKRERIITWCIHDNVVDNVESERDYNFVDQSQQNITQTVSQSAPAMFINYTTSSSSSLTFHSTSTSPYNYCDDINNDNTLSLSENSSPLEDFSFWTEMSNGNDNIESLLSLFELNEGNDLLT